MKVQFAKNVKWTEVFSLTKVHALVYSRKRYINWIRSAPLIHSYYLALTCDLTGSHKLPIIVWPLITWTWFICFNFILLDYSFEYCDIHIYRLFNIISDVIYQLFNNSGFLLIIVDDIIIGILSCLTYNLVNSILGLFDILQFCLNNVL